MTLSPQRQRAIDAPSHLYLPDQIINFQRLTHHSRERIGTNILIFSAAVIIIILIALAFSSRNPANEGLRNTLSNSFNMLFPAVASWVGTIIAFYFSRDNFVTAAAAQQLQSTPQDQYLRETPALTGMIPAESITGLEFDGDESRILLSEIVEKLNQENGGEPVVTRIPIFLPNKIAKYILHKSTILEFQVAHPLPSNNDGAGVPTSPTFTLKDLLDFKDNRALASRLAFISANQTLADAQTAMNNVPGCQDIFVTKTGSPSEPVVGWIPNSRLAQTSHS